MAVGQNRFGILFWGIGATHMLVYFSGDVQWRYDLDFDPWPYESTSVYDKGGGVVGESSLLEGNAPY